MRALLSKFCLVAGNALIVAAFSSISNATAQAAESNPPNGPSAHVTFNALASKLKVGDVIFIRVTAKPFREVAAATDSWTNHVGIVVEVSGKEPLIGESTIPFSRIAPFSRFAARSEGGRMAVSRLQNELTGEQEQNVLIAARQRVGIFYDTGFNLHSRGQFCSRFVREVLREATGETVGEVETFVQLLSRHPKTDLSFWKIWYFGHIPWQRQTVTPASLLHSAALRPVFDGTAFAHE
jgi:hypothetical protein